MGLRVTLVSLWITMCVHMKYNNASHIENITFPKFIWSADMGMVIENPVFLVHHTSSWLSSTD